MAVLHRQQPFAVARLRFTVAVPAVGTPADLVPIDGRMRRLGLVDVAAGPFGDLGVTLVSPRCPGRTDHAAFDAVALAGVRFAAGIEPQDLMKNAVATASSVPHAATSDAPMPRTRAGAAR